MADKPLVTGKFDPTQLLGGATMAFGAAGNLLNGAGDMNAQDRGANIGTAVGGTIGSVAQAFIPIPGLGEMVGQVGGMVGTLASKGRARREANKLASDSASRTYGAFHEQSNVDPYGAGNSAYVADEGGMADMGLSMFMLNTKLPVKATVNPLDTKLMVEGGRAPGFLPPGSIEDEIQFREDGGVILNSGGGRFRAWAKARNLSPQEAADKIKRRRGKTSDPNAGSMFSTLNSETAIPVAQEGVFTSTKPKIIPRPKHTLNPVTPLFDKPEDRKAYQEYITSEAEKALQSGGDAKYLIETPYHPIYDEKGEAHNNCINGICGLSGGKLKWSNAPDQGRYLSNPDFSTNIQYGGEDYYQATDNFDVGDHVQLLNMYGHPFHSKMIYKVDRDEDGKKKYHVIHNGGGDTFKADVWSEEQLKNMVKVNQTTGVAGALVYRPGKALDMPKIQADRDAANSPAVRKGAAERRAREAYTNERDLDYTYKMRDDYVDKDDAPQGVKMYMEFANNKSRLKDIANMMGVDLEDVHDELPNVLGQLMVENKGHRSPKTKDVDFFFTGAENLYEEMVLPSSKSIGPGQIRLDSLTPEMREKFGIKNEIDLYDFSKVIPLMLGINLENRKWMRRQGDKMSEKLIGIPGVKADDLKGGIGRWTPYLYQGLPADPTTKLKRELKRDANTLETLTGGPVEVEDFDTYNTPENRRRVAYLNEHGSYADKVYHAANAILERTAPYVNDEKTLQEVVVKGIKKKRKGGLVDDVSKLGYSDNSPYKGAPFLDINTPNGTIDMSNTSQDLWGIDETGFTQFMKGGSPQMYKFPGKKVREIPKAQDGYINALGNSLFGKKPYTPSTPANTPKWLPYDRNAPMKQASDIGTMGIDPSKVIIKPEAKVTPVQTRPLVQSTDIESMSPLFKVAEQAELQQRMGPELRRQATIAATQEEIAKRKTVGDNTSTDRGYINSDLGKSERERLNRVYADKTEGVYYNEKTGEVEQTWWDRTKQENPKLVPGLENLGHLALLATDIEGGLALGRMGLKYLAKQGVKESANVPKLHPEDFLPSRGEIDEATFKELHTGVDEATLARLRGMQVGNVRDATQDELLRARDVYWRNKNPNQFHDYYTPRQRAIIDEYGPGSNPLEGLEQAAPTNTGGSNLDDDTFRNLMEPFRSRTEREAIRNRERQSIRDLDARTRAALARERARSGQGRTLMDDQIDHTIVNMRRQYPGVDFNNAEIRRSLREYLERDLQAQANDVYTQAPTSRGINLRKTSTTPKETVVRNVSRYRINHPIVAEEAATMTPEEFKTTVLKPNLQLKQFDMDYAPVQQQEMTALEYLDELNKNKHRLNEIIAKNNAKGNPKYWVNEFTPDGFTIGNEFGTTSNMHVDFVPGRTAEAVRDINNVKYYKSFPGMNMAGTSQGVYGDLDMFNAMRSVQSGAEMKPGAKGTRLYESLNEYLKELGLGRVKPGFNSQSNSSYGLWKDAVNKGKAVGYIGTEGLMYGMFKMGIPPLVVGAILKAQGQQEEKKPFREGGIVNNLNEEDMYTFLPGELPDSVVNQMGKGGATCSCQHKHGGMPHDVYAQGGMVDDDELMIPSMKKGGKWIQKAVNPAHKGYCTPMTKSTCTPRRKALARTFKKHHGFHKAQDGMMTPNDEGVYEQQGQEQPEGMEQQGAPEEQQQRQAPPQQQQPQQPQASVVNIEFGELVVDPQSGEIIKEFTNPSRYSLHADNPMKEPSGNFVTLPQNVVVIPRKLAKGYKEGNKLTRSTMLRQVLKDQMDREATGQQEYATTGGDVPHAQQGWSDMSLLNTSLDPRTAEADALTKARTANAAITASINGTAPVVAGVRKYPAAPGYNPNQPFTPSSTMPAIPGGTKNFSDILKDKSANELYPGQDYWDKPAVERMGMTDLDRTLGRTPTAETRFSNLMDLPEDVVPGGPNGPKEETDKMSALPFVLESQFLPAGLQFLQSMQGNPDLKMHTNRGYGDARAAIGQMPTDVNYDAAKATVGRGQRARDRSYMNFRRPDIAGEMGVGYGEGINRLGQIEQDEYNQEQQAKGAKLQAMGQMSVAQGADLQAAEREFGLAKEQDAASKRTMMNSALSESTSRFAKYFMEGEKIKAGNLAAHFYKLDPFTQKMVVDQDKVEAYIASQAALGFDLSYNTDLQTKAKKEGKANG